jgi:hypothetical protein
MTETAPADLSAQLVRTTRPLRPDLIEAVKRLRPGQQIRVTQTVRVGDKEWPASVTGRFRELKCLVTGLATRRVPRDEIIVPTIHFTKENGELSSVTLDEHSRLEIQGD